MLLDQLSRDAVVAFEGNSDIFSSNPILFEATLSLFLSFWQSNRLPLVQSRFLCLPVAVLALNVILLVALD